MFGFLIDRAKLAIDTAIGHVVWRILAGLPFLVALWFLTRAANMRLTREFGAETANLTVGLAYAALGVLALLILRSAEGSLLSDRKEAEPSPTELPATASASVAFSEADRELLMAAMTSAAPVALPAVVRALLRNIPLILVVIAALFVLSRSSPEEAPAQPSPNEPAGA